MRIAVVIPTLDQAASVEAAIASARAAAVASDRGSDSSLGSGSGSDSGSGRELDVFVVDGSCGDATVERVLSVRGGRARRLDAGRRECRGDVLLFHADLFEELDLVRERLGAWRLGLDRERTAARVRR